MRFPKTLLRLFSNIIPVLPLLRRIVLVLLREFTGYSPQQPGEQAGFQQQAAPGAPEYSEHSESGQQALQQLLQQNDMLAKALQRARVRQRITLWISLTALLLSSILWFSRP